MREERDPLQIQFGKAADLATSSVRPSVPFLCPFSPPRSICFSSSSSQTACLPGCSTRHCCGLMTLKGATGASPESRGFDNIHQEHPSSWFIPKIILKFPTYSQTKERRYPTPTPISGEWRCLLSYRIVGRRLRRACPITGE